MKKLTLIIGFCLLGLCAQSQDTLRYQYATLEVDMPNIILNVEYNNGYTEDLMTKLKLSKKEGRHQLVFRCFEYLNNNGYEMVNGSQYQKWDKILGVMTYNQVEYIFKRKIISK